MRALVIGLALCALAACGGSDVPSPAERLNGSGDAAAAEIIDPGQVTLWHDGLIAGPDAFYFGAGQTEIEAAITRAVGEPVSAGDMPECGAGPMQFASYPGGLSVNFQDGILVGWSLEGGADNIVLRGDIAIGTPRSDVEAASGFAMIEASTLGEEFMLGDALAGFFEEGRVSMLYAGTQCFFR